MKNITFLIFCFLLPVPGLVTAQTTPGAVEYMEELLLAFQEMEGAKWKYLKAVTRGRSARKVEKRRGQLISEYANAITQARKVRSFEKDTLLKPALLEYLKLTKTVLKEDYDKILDMEAIAEESYDAMEAYIMVQRKTDEKFQAAADLLEEGQEAFATEHSIDIVEGESSKRASKINKASEALNHYNDVFLIFFKSNVQETYFLEAMAVGDLTAMDQSASALSSYAEEGIAELNEVKLIKNDFALTNAAKNLLKFYKIECDTDLKRILDFYIVADDFEKVNKKFEAIKKSKRTQADINKINKASEAYNRGVSQINSTIDRNNKKRDTALKAWNKAVQAFFDRNS